MKINAIEIFQIDLPLQEGRYGWAGGKSVGVFDSAVVRLTCDDGRQGHGEACPLGPAYLPAFATGRHAGWRRAERVPARRSPREDVLGKAVMWFEG